MVGLTHEKIPVNALVPGMYISRLDRPWIETPFPIQGFHIKDEEDVKNLRDYCQFVYIDRQRSRTTVRLSRAPVAPRPATPEETANEVIRVNHVQYKREHPMSDVVGQASVLHRDVVHTLDQLAHQVHEGKAPDVRATRHTAVKMVENVVTNPDAFIWVSHLKAKDSHSYAHSIRASIWAIVFGRHLGIKKEQLQDLAAGMLLCDIGMAHIPKEILEKKSALAFQEQRLLESHVAKSLELLKGCKGLNQNVLEVVACHHERHNGKGYPRGLRGAQIPLNCKIAGLVDLYDNLTCPRHMEKAVSPADAVVRLHKMRFEEFQGELIDEFIQAIGIYPTGSLIEFKTGEVGIISEQNEGWRLRPKVVLLLNGQKKALGKPLPLDLLNPDGKNPIQLEVLRSLPEGSYGIDLMKYRTRGLSKFLGLGNALFA
ncbi:MAG: DUF3391 domain-containing protein [Gammaproteobacteria bacterium]|nr:DUF3391 domain-containing protein [Gammaproteobacteria bacterium]